VGIIKAGPVLSFQFPPQDIPEHVSWAATSIASSNYVFQMLWFGVLSINSQLLTSQCTDVPTEHQVFDVRFQTLVWRNFSSKLHIKTGSFVHHGKTTKPCLKKCKEIELENGSHGCACSKETQGLLSGNVSLIPNKTIEQKWTTTRPCRVDNMLLPKAQIQLSSLHDVQQGLTGLDKLIGG
jgi:hypothetical protein